MLAALPRRGADLRDVAEQFDAWCTVNIRPWYEDHVYWDAIRRRRLGGADIDIEARIPSDVICAAAEADPADAARGGPVHVDGSATGRSGQGRGQGSRGAAVRMAASLRGRSEQGRTRGSARRARVRREGSAGWAAAGGVQQAEQAPRPVRDRATRASCRMKRAPSEPSRARSHRLKRGLLSKTETSAALGPDVNQPSCRRQDQRRGGEFGDLHGTAILASSAQ